MRSFKMIRLAAGTAFSLACLPAVAETWSMSGALAAPERVTATATRTTPFFSTARGAGIKLVPGSTGSAIVYLPVTAPNKVTYNFMHVRVEGVSKALIRAELYEQAITGSALPARLGILTVAGAPSDGVVLFSTPLKARPIDLSKFNYFVRLELCKGIGTDPKVYDVVLTDVRCMPGFDGKSYCPPPPPPPEWSCKPISLP